MPAGSTNSLKLPTGAELSGPVLIIVGDVVSAGAIAPAPARIAELAA